MRMCSYSCAHFVCMNVRRGFARSTSRLFRCRPCQSYKVSKEYDVVVFHAGWSHDHKAPLDGGRPEGLEAKDDVAPLYYRLRGCAGSQAGFY